MTTYDLAIVGSGFAGSLLAMIARRIGLSVVLLERDTHPRIVIGESSTPLSNLMIEELATRYDLPMLAPLSKWGTWQQSYPHIACGLKRGFTFHHHVLGQPASSREDRQDQLLVAASPHDAIADTHWYRADFDQFLVQQAQALGADYFDKVSLHRIVERDDETHLEGARHGEPIRLTAKFVVDATGPRGFLHRALNLAERSLPGFPHTQALYNHFTGVRRLENTSGHRLTGSPPYPIDQAAVHHVFDGGWIWVLQFNNGVTSAGVAATEEFAASMNFGSGAEAWQSLLQQIPALEEQFRNAQPMRRFTHLSQLSFRSASIVGQRWGLLPSAAGFVDPLLSTGFPLTLLGISRIAEILANDWQTPRFAASLNAYARQTDAELLAASRLIGALYRCINNFPVFVALSLLYFAAVSYSETARRLNKPGLASSFLLHDNPIFGPALTQLCDRARPALTAEESEQLARDILAAIEPFNVAGLGNSDRKNWYPVDAGDLFNSAHKLGATQEDIHQLLRRCGFEATSMESQAARS